MDSQKGRYYCGRFFQSHLEEQAGIQSGVLDAAQFNQHIVPNLKGLSLLYFDDRLRNKSSNYSKFWEKSKNGRMQKQKMG